MDSNLLIILLGGAGLLYLFRSSTGSNKLIMLAVAGIGAFLLLGDRVPSSSTGGKVIKGDTGKMVSISSILNSYDIDVLYDQYCKGNSRKSTTCQCLIKPVHDDIRTEFSKRKIDRLKSENPTYLRNKVKESYLVQEQSINDCLNYNDTTVDQVIRLVSGH